MNVRPTVHMKPPTLHTTASVFSYRCVRPCIGNCRTLYINASDPTYTGVPSPIYVDVPEPTSESQARATKERLLGSAHADVASIGAGLALAARAMRRPAPTEPGDRPPPTDGGSTIPIGAPAAGAITNMP